VPHAVVVAPHGTVVHVPVRPGREHDWQLPEHAASQHTPPAQCEVAQSPSTLHSLLWLHFGQFEPPQSTSVSSPSCFMSVQLAHASAKQYWPDGQPAIDGVAMQVTQLPLESHTPV